MADETPRKGQGVERALAIWRRRWWLALPAFALPLVAGVVLVLSMPRVYQSRALVLVDRQQVPEEFVRPTVTSVLEVRLRTISEEILSRSRLDALITRFGLYPKLRDKEASELVMERMRRDIQLDLYDSGGRSGSATIAFSISYRGTDPQTVAQVTNALASSYIEENLKVRERQSTGTADFLRIQLADTKKRLDVLEQRVSEFKRQHLGELPEQMQTNLAVLGQLGEQVRQITVSQVRLAEKRELLELQAQAATPGTTVVTGASGEAVVAVDARLVQLARLQQELSDLLRRFTERYPDVQNVRAQIALLERDIATTPAPAPERRPAAGDSGASLTTNPVATRIRQALAELDAEMKTLKEEERRLRAAFAAYERRVENTPRREQEFQELSRDYATTKELHVTLTRRYDEAQLAEQMEQRQKGEQFRILDPAVPSAEPAAPERGKLLGMVLALSLGLAGGLVLLAEQLDTSFHAVDELRAFTPAPVLVSIPRLVTERDRRRRQRRLQAATAGVVLGAMVLAVAAHYVARNNDQLVWLVSRGPARRGL